VKSANSLFIIFAFIVLANIDLFSQKEKDSLKYDIQDLVIVGTRTTEKIIDIPYSVFSVDRKELAFGKKVSAKDVLADVPGLFLQSRYGNHDLRVSIRGFGTRSNSGVRGVKILQDGIPESEPDGETVIDAVDLTSLGGVEVVKGNLSSLYANAPGGVINFKSDMYFPTSFVTLNNQMGKYGFRQNGIKFGVKQDNNRFFLSYNYQNMNGYRQHSGESQHLINTIYQGVIGEKSTISVMGNFVRGFIRLPGSLTKEEFNSDPFQASPYALTNDFKRITSKGRAAVRFITYFDNYEKNELELTAYGGIKELEKADQDVYIKNTRYSIGSTIKYSNKAVLFDRKNIFTLGLDYAYQAGPINNFENILGTPNISKLLGSYDLNLSNIGVYFLDHLNILPEKLDLFVSSRFDRYIYSKDSYFYSLLTDTSRVLQQLTPKIGINFKLAPNIALYSSYGIGYDFPALSEMTNNLLTSDIKYSLNPDLNPQKSSNFEIGIKGNILNFDSEFMRKLFFEITYFDYLIRDEIVPYQISNITYFKNAAKTRRQGIETGIKSEPFEGIEMVVNYTITNFKYKEYTSLVNTQSQPILENYKDNYVPSVPTNIMNFILNYEFEISEELSGLLQWDCDFISKMYVNDKNDETSPGYFYGNMMFGLNFKFEKFGLITFIGANNIFDKRYAGFININDYNKRYYETGEPRTIYAGLNITFKY